jgi:hypothetical protein
LTAQEERRIRRRRLLLLPLVLLLLGSVPRHHDPKTAPPTTCEQRWQARRDKEMAYWAGQSETDVHYQYVYNCKEATHLAQ